MSDVIPMTLRLPVCPRCHDTKKVVENQTRLLIPTTGQYSCTGCGVSWWATPDKPVRGTIVDYKGNWQHYR